MTWKWMYPCPGKIMVLLHSSGSLGLRMWPVEFMRSWVNKYIEMWSFGGCFSQLLFPLLLCYLFFSVVQAWPVSFGSWCRDLGSGCWVPTAEIDWSHLDVLRGLQPSNTPSSGESKQRKAQVSLWVLREMLDLLWVEAWPPAPAVLCWWSSFPCFLWRSWLTMDYFPPEKWKQFCCSSSLLEVFNGRCAAAALEGLRSLLLSHHRVRERHVGMKSLLRDSWTWTWLFLCLLWMKAKSQLP